MNKELHQFLVQNHKVLKQAILLQKRLDIDLLDIATDLYLGKPQYPWNADTIEQQMRKDFDIDATGLMDIKEAIKKVMQKGDANHGG